MKKHHGKYGMTRLGEKGTGPRGNAHAQIMGSIHDKYPSHGKQAKKSRKSH